MNSRLFLALVVVAGLAVAIVGPISPAKRTTVPSKVSVAKTSPAPSPGRMASVSERVVKETTPAISSLNSKGVTAPTVQAPRPAVTPSPDFVQPEGTHLVAHVVQRNESLESIVSHYLSDSVYMRRSELELAVRQVNCLTGRRLKPGDQLWIPGIPVHPILDKPNPTPKDFMARGIYLTAYSAGSAFGLDLIKNWKAEGGNAVVFDIKDFDGKVHIPFSHAYAPEGDITVRNLPKFIHYLHSIQMHAIVRIAVFRDEHLAKTYPQLAVHSRATGKAWTENGKLVWTDPSNPEVQQYNLDLARVAANAGADEVQFDYVRFPAEGDQADARFEYQKEHPDWPRSKVITDFVARAHQMLRSQGTLFSIDVFGVMAWAKQVDLVHTGQNISELARHVDVMSPMIYPSHFYGFDGYKTPGDAPEHFISESMQRFEQATSGSGVLLRPWLQAFGWHTKTYSANYILTQVRVARDEGGVGYLFWNARNDYSKPLQAMPELRSENRTPSPAPKIPAQDVKSSAK